MPAIESSLSFTFLSLLFSLVFGFALAWVLLTIGLMLYLAAQKFRKFRDRQRARRDREWEA